MGDPITGMLLAGSVATSAIGQYQQGKAAEASAAYNAEITRIKAAQEARRIRRVGKFQQGEIRANVGKAGVTMSGSALLAMQEAITVNEQDALLTQLNAESEAEMLRRKGKMAKRQANVQIASTILKGASY